VTSPLVIPGRPGMVSGLRPLTELREETDAAIERLVELRLGRLVTGRWSQHSGPVWTAPFAEYFEGEELHPVAVRTLRDAGLERVESLAECSAEPGTFFLSNVPDAGHRWGDGVTRWGSHYLGLPTALHEFEGNGLDATGVHHLTPSGSPAFVTGLQGQAVHLDRGPYYSLPAAAATAFNPGSGDWTVAVKTQLLEVGFGVIASHGGLASPALPGWQLRFVNTSGGNHRVALTIVKPDLSQIELTSFSALITVDGEWHDIVFVADKLGADTGYLWIDGVVRDTKDLSSYSTIVADTDFYVGRNENGGFWAGYIDQLGWWKEQAWTEDQVVRYRFAPVGSPPVGLVIDATGTRPRWGAFPRLYVHLADATSPARTSVLAQVSVWLGERGQAVPQLGREKLTDGGFDEWDSSSELTHWPETMPSGFALSQETELVRSGSFAARIDWDGTVGVSLIAQVQTAVIGAWYRVSGEYLTGPENAAADPIRIGVGNGTDGWLLAAGRSPGGEGVDLQRTGGEWRRFYFDVLAHTAAPLVRILARCASGAPGFLIVDRVSFRPIYSWRQAQGRLQAGSAPSAEVGTNDSIFGSDRSGRGEIVAANGDGWLQRLLGSFHASGQPATFYEGGRFRNGQPVPADDWRPIFTGRTEKPVVTDTAVRIALRDIRGELHRLIPPRVYTRLDHPRLVDSADGARRPIFFGPATGISPVRIDHTDDGLGIYEIADTGWDLQAPIAPAGLKAVDAVYAYTSTDAADRHDATQRATLAAGVDYSVDLAKGTLTVLSHVSPVIFPDDRFLDFDVGGSMLSAVVAAGTYASAEALAAALQAAIRTAIGGGDVTGLAEFDLELGAYRVGRSSGTFNLRSESGPNRDLGLYETIGIAASADQTGMSSYLGSQVLVDVDDVHVIRVDAQGYQDDASGTYTGSASGLVTLGADVVRLLWHRLLQRPLSSIDEPSFAAARTLRPAPRGRYQRTAISTGDVFQRLRLSTLSDLVIDGAGVIHYVPYTSTVPSGAEVLEDRDYLSWSMARPLRDVFSEIVIEFGEDPATGAVATRRWLSPEVALTAGRPDGHAERVYLTVGNDAQALARDLAMISAAQPREVVCSLKARLRDARPGDIVRLTRLEGALDATGQLVLVPFRIASVVAAERVQLRLVELVEIGS
jgi:hypothetical protein